MSWAMKRLHLLSIALILCGHINGFSVWNRTSIIDWQAGRANVTWNQNFQLATPEVLSRKGVNGNVGGGGGGDSSSVMLTSKVQTAQHDSSFVQSSGGAAAHAKPVLNAHSQAAPTIHRQDNYTAQSSGLYWYNSLKPNNCGPSLSQSWPVKAHYAHGFWRPSSSQSAGTTNQVSGSQSQSSYQTSSTTPVLTGQSATSQAQSSFDSTLYPGQASSRYINSQDQRITSYSQFVANTNQVSGSQTQSLYQPGTTAQVLASQSAFTSQVQGNYGAESSGHAKWYHVVQGQTIPSSLQVSGLQTQASSQPSSTTLGLAGESASTPQGQSSGAAKWHNVLWGQNIPSFSHVSGFQTQSLYQHNSTAQVPTGHSASISQAQSSGASALYQDPTSGRNLTSQGQTIPFSSQSVVTTNQFSGFQNQMFEPNTTTQALVGHSASASRVQGSQQAAKWQVINPSGFRTWLLNTSISPSLRSDTQSASSVLSFLNQSAGTSAMSPNNVHSPGYHASTWFSPVKQTAASPSVSLAKPSQQTQGSMVQSGIASLVTSQTSPHVEATSQGTDLYAAVPSQGASQNFAVTSFQGALPQVRRDYQYSSVCNFPLGFCRSSQRAANNKFV